VSVYVKVIAEEDLPVLQKYLNDDGVILIHKIIADKLERVLGHSAEETFLPEYDFGGEADKWVDIICDEQHFAYKTILEMHKELKE